MSADSRLHNDTPMHPEDNGCIMVAFGAGAQVSLDCSQFLAIGGVVRIFNSSAGALGYKFSAEAVASISVGATSGPTACSRLAANSSADGFIPVGMPYLHVQNPNAGNVYVSQASELR